MTEKQQPRDGATVTSAGGLFAGLSALQGKNKTKAKRAELLEVRAKAAAIMAAHRESSVLRRAGADLLEPFPTREDPAEQDEAIERQESSAAVTTKEEPARKEEEAPPPRIKARGWGSTWFQAQSLAEEVKEHINLLLEEEGRPEEERQTAKEDEPIKKEEARTPVEEDEVVVTTTNEESCTATKGWGRTLCQALSSEQEDEESITEETTNEEPKEEVLSESPPTTKGGWGWFAAKASSAQQPKEEARVEPSITESPQTTRASGSTWSVAKSLSEEDEPIDREPGVMPETNEDPVTREEVSIGTKPSQTPKAQGWGSTWFPAKSPVHQENQIEKEPAVKPETKDDPVVREEVSTTEPPKTPKAQGWGSTWFPAKSPAQEVKLIEEKPVAMPKTKEEPAITEPPQRMKAKGWGRTWSLTKVAEDASVPQIKSDTEPIKKVTTEEPVVREESAKQVEAIKQEDAPTEEDEPIKIESAATTRQKDESSITSPPQTPKAKGWGRTWFQAQSPSSEAEALTKKVPVMPRTNKEPVPKEEEPSIKEPLQTPKAHDSGMTWFRTKVAEDANEPTQNEGKQIEHEPSPTTTKDDLMEKAEDQAIKEEPQTIEENEPIKNEAAHTNKEPVMTVEKEDSALTPEEQPIEEEAQKVGEEQPIKDEDEQSKPTKTAEQEDFVVKPEEQPIKAEPKTTEDDEPIKNKDEQSNQEVPIMTVTKEDLVEKPEEQPAKGEPQTAEEDEPSNKEPTTTAAKVEKPEEQADKEPTTTATKYLVEKPEEQRIKGECQMPEEDEPIKNDDEQINTEPTVTATEEEEQPVNEKPQIAEAIEFEPVEDLEPIKNEAEETLAKEDEPSIEKPILTTKARGWSERQRENITATMLRCGVNIRSAGRARLLWILYALWAYAFWEESVCLVVFCYTRVALISRDHS